MLYYIDNRGTEITLFAISYRKNDGSLFPLIRWHQTMDVGFLPNQYENFGFSAVAMDTYNGAVHPTNKQLPAKRLAIAGRGSKGLHPPSGNQNFVFPFLRSGLSTFTSVISQNFSNFFLNIVF